MDDHGHGTHTSGIMAGIGGNGAGIAGLGWSTRVMALKFIDYQGWGTDADAVECIDYVIHEKLVDGVNVVAINASWGGEPGNLFLRNAIDRAGDAGIVFCASAGNDDEDNDAYPHYPASYDCPTIISVAATGASDKLTYFSNYGDCTVDLGAPGGRILSTLPGDLYAAWDGTSMAAPFVTGAVALCAAQFPVETAAQRVERILSTVKPVEELAGRCMTGGRLDVTAALGYGDTGADAEAPVTTVVGADDRPHDIRTTVRFLASDGAAGSGVAATEWRIDGGEWRTGDTVSVKAPRGVATVRPIEYRSRDRAGNVEEARSCQVIIDTTATAADDRPPGATLPPSPVSGGVAATDRLDSYRVRLQRGETLSVAADGPPGLDAPIALWAPRAEGGPVAVAWPFGGVWSDHFAYRAPATGTYSLRVHWSWGPSPYRFSYAVSPKGVDVVPPAVAVQRPRGAWHNVPVAVTFAATDDKGSGVARTEVSLDEGLSWQTAGGVVIDAPADHANDGQHHVLGRALDNAGNLSDPRGAWVRIDTEGPTTEAWAEYVSPGRGWRFMVIGFRVHDREPRVRCQLVIRSAATGRVVLRRGLGWRVTTDYAWWEDEYTDYEWLDASLPKGTYNVKIGGWTHDGAGNRWAKAECLKQLVIR
jgi:subtilisin family serine protease